MTTLTEEMALVVANLESREWIQGKERDNEGRVCAHGAVMTCQGLRPGDDQIIRAVMRAKGLTESYNDENGRTKDDVLKLMRQIEITDADLESTFGPMWREVVAVVRRAAVLTRYEANRLGHPGAATRLVGGGRAASGKPARGRPGSLCRKTRRGPPRSRSRPHTKCRVS